MYASFDRLYLNDDNVHLVNKESLLFANHLSEEEKASLQVIKSVQGLQKKIM